uniref:LSM-interacting domain-containing protein n=1 Tax=Magallana gigas TaxID=29159 RepID=K1PTT4_MAGGI
MSHKGDAPSRRGKARTQLSLVPRSIQRTPAPSKGAISKSNPLPSLEANGQAAASATATKMSNDDFRKMLLKK